jgi:predicted nucleotidyltransferase
MIEDLTRNFDTLTDQGEIERIYLFGSWVRGDFDGFSDIDLLVVVKSGTDPRDFELPSDKFEAENHMDIIVIQSTEFENGAHQRGSLLNAIFEEGIVLWPSSIRSQLPPCRPGRQ